MKTCPFLKEECITDDCKLYCPISGECKVVMDSDKLESIISVLTAILNK
jgi:hypothetical protein